MFDNEYISLDRIATRLCLPQKYIQQQTEAGKIPHLIVGGRLRFQERAVRAALDKIEQAIPDSKQSLFSKLCAAKSNKKVSSFVEVHRELLASGVVVKFVGGAVNG